MIHDHAYTRRDRDPAHVFSALVIQMDMFLSKGGRPWQPPAPDRMDIVTEGARAAKRKGDAPAPSDERQPKRGRFEACLYCGTLFEAETLDALFCSTECSLFSLDT